MVVFGEYYVKTAARRLLFIVLLALLTFALGFLLLGGRVVPADGMTIETWLQRFYLCGGLSLLLGLVCAGIWFGKGLFYDANSGKKITSLYYGLGAVTLVGAVLIAVAVLPRAYEWGVPAQIWLVLLAPVYYYLDSVFAGAYPVQFVPPCARLLYERAFGLVAPTILAQDVRFQKNFFTEQLCLVPVGKDGPAVLHAEMKQTLTWKGQQYSFFYPVSEQLLDYIAPKELVDRVQLVVQGEGERENILVRLVLPGSDSRLAPLYIDKVYKEEQVVLAKTTPVLALWPYFELTGLKSWSRYYTYYDDNGTADVYVRPQKKWDLPQTLRRVETAGQGRKEIHCGSSYPQVFVAGSRDDKQAYGLLVPEAPELINVTNKRKCAVSVDFGTTNTTICYAMEATAPGPMVLHNKMRQFFAFHGNRSCLREFFLPDDAEVGCAWIMSAFHSYNDMPGTTERMFQKGNIYFVDKFAALSNLTNVTTDLKWDLEHRELTEGFLEQICTQCLAELAANGATEIDWRFSYPKSFTVNEKLSYDRIREQVMANLELNTGTPEKPELCVHCHMDETFIVPESVAVAAYYDRDYGADRSNGIVCMDIGGGSTDLAFWYGDRPDITWQASLRLAGRQIFRDVLFTRANIKLFKRLGLGNEFNKEVDELVELAENKQNTGNYDARNAFGIKLDALLKEREQEIRNAWGAGCKNAVGLKRIREAILFAVSGLLYYAGMVFGQQYKEGTFNHLTRFHAVYIGGNGSKLLDLATDGAYKESSAEYKILAQIFRDGIRCNLGEKAFATLMNDLDFKVITINKSRQPKEEVAYGLLYDETAAIEKLLEELGHTGVSQSAVAGEVFLDDDMRNTDGIITRKNLKHRLTVDTKMPIFKNFIKDLNTQTEHFLDYKMSIYSDEFLFLIREAVNKALADKRLQADNDMAVEPLFALAL
jgi:hypothetical protein